MSSRDQKKDVLRMSTVRTCTAISLVFVLKFYTKSQAEKDMITKVLQKHCSFP